MEPHESKRHTTDTTKKGKVKNGTKGAEMGGSGAGKMVETRMTITDVRKRKTSLGGGKEGEGIEGGREGGGARARGEVEVGGGGEGGVRARRGEERGGGRHGEGVAGVAVLGEGMKGPADLILPPRGGNWNESGRHARDREGGRVCGKGMKARMDGGRDGRQAMGKEE